MKKTIITVLTTLFITSAMAQSRLSIKLVTGAKGLLPKSSVFIRLNFIDTKTVSPEYTVYSYGANGLNGLTPSSTQYFIVELPRRIEDIAISGFTIRHESAVGNVAEPYDNWDLKGLEVSFIDIFGSITLTSYIYNSKGLKFLTHFTQFNRTLTLNR